MKNIYICGPTVYSEVHIGNLRPILTFDIFIRSLRYLGQKVNLIHNITDIDDKIINRALELNITEKDLTDKMISKYFKLLQELNIQQPNFVPTVRENMHDIINFIQNLIDKNFAYKVNGSVYFDVSKLDTYGDLSNRKNLSLNPEGDKKHADDFALWKAKSSGFQFDSPWSKGRPGWHTECVAFIAKYSNNQTLDIHGGGIDLLFPHHENERIQYIANFNREITKTWKHVGHINIEGEKMSKSLGNVFDAKTFNQKYGNDTLRVLFLTAGITNPIDISNEYIDSIVSESIKYQKSFIQSQLFLKLNKELTFNNDAESIANHFSNWEFSKGVKLINQSIKGFNTKKNIKDATLIIESMKLIGFNFAKILLQKSDIDLYIEWNKLRDQNKFEAADQIRKKLIEKKII